MMETRQLYITKNISLNFQNCKKLTKYESASNWAILQNLEDMCTQVSSMQQHNNSLVL
jgi:hypothetical protein